MVRNLKVLNVVITSVIFYSIKDVSEMCFSNYKNLFSPFRSPSCALHVQLSMIEFRMLMHRYVKDLVNKFSLLYCVVVPSLHSRLVCMFPFHL
mgnify:CR=1 FL=1